jgi:hypothetical protein
MASGCCERHHDENMLQNVNIAHTQIYCRSWMTQVCENVARNIS